MLYTIFVYALIYGQIYLCTWSRSKKNDVFVFFDIVFSNLIFCEILWLTPIKKLHVRIRLNFYLQKKAGLLGNYVAL